MEEKRALDWAISGLKKDTEASYAPLKIQGKVSQEANWTIQSLEDRKRDCITMDTAEKWMNYMVYSMGLSAPTFEDVDIDHHFSISRLTVHQSIVTSIAINKGVSSRSDTNKDLGEEKRRLFRTKRRLKYLWARGSKIVGFGPSGWGHFKFPMRTTVVEGVGTGKEAAETQCQSLQ